MDGGAWWAAVRGVAKSWTRLIDFTGLWPGEVSLGDESTIRGNYSEKFRKGNGTPLQYSCLENPMDGGVW